MAAEGYINSIARLRVIEKRLMGRDTIERAASAATFEEALMVFSECGYEVSDTEDSEQFQEADPMESAIQAELDFTYRTVDELAMKNRTIEVFKLRTDIVNLKLLLKLRLQGAELGIPLQKGGVYEEAVLRAMVKTGDYSSLPREISDALEMLEVEMYKKPDPRRLSTVLDSAYISHAYKVKDPFVREYFRATADFDNLIMLVRMRACGMNAEDYKKCLLPEGSLKASALVSAYDMSDDEIISRVIFDPLEPNDGIRILRERMRDSFAACSRGKGASALELGRDNYLISLASKGRHDISSIAPIVGYMLAKEQEVRCVRLILTAKRNDLPRSVIDERLGELYG